MASSSVKGAAPQRQTSSRWRRSLYRFWIGIVLGALFVITLGWFVPLLAQSPEQVMQTLTAQSIPDSPGLEDAAVDGSPEEPQPVIPTDIGNHWATGCLRELALRRLIPVDDQARFYPDDPTTWAALAEMLNLSLPTDGAYAGASAAEAALNLPSAVNVLYTYPQRYYDPGRSVARAEAVTALAAKMALPYAPQANELLTASLTDGQAVADYGREGVAAALTAGVLVNYPEPQQFEGNRPITRGEMAALICQARPESALRSTIPAEWIARPQDLPTQRQPSAELRGVWLTNIDSEVLFSRENLEEAVQRLKALNINTLYPVVWNFGYPQFPSATAERVLGRKQRLWPGENPAFEETQQDRDMLQEIIELGHAEGMAVIPWFEFGFMAPAEYSLLDQHPDWFTQRQDGSRELQFGVETFTWMNPLHPRTQRLLLLLMAEVLENYDVDGIQVDDHLGMPVEMGYDPFTIDLYRQEHEGEDPPEDYSDREWMRWRADKVTAFMAEVRRLIDLRKPEALLSVSPNPYPFSYAKYLQDWPTWEEMGLLDELIIQVYRNDVDRFVWELNKPATVTASRSTPTSIGLLSGLRGRPTDIELLTDQLAAVRDRNYAGVSYFFYQSLWSPGVETLEERETQFRTSFSQPAIRP
ncbi:MAG: family 10 glycosylhydrolase [Leptolyngbya sp. SIO1E4]|nr:family 10 glycosylhydrolase [Leptolyngbya sp. SIO1E4]